MIRVTVEHRPNGNCAHAREIARMEIGNIADHAAASDYEISASNEADPRSGQPAFVASGMTVRHRREDSIWMLVAKAVDRVAASWVAASAEK
jgi:hypothetical protein